MTCIWRILNNRGNENSLGLKNRLTSGENANPFKVVTPGDIVLADRGFDISDSVGLYGASLSIPAFTRGNARLPALDAV